LFEVRRGAYEVTVELTGSGDPAATAGTVRVLSAEKGEVLAHRSFRWADVSAPVAVAVLVPGDGPLRVDVESARTGDLAVGTIRAVPTSPLPRADSPVSHGYALGLLWMLGLVLAAVLLAPRNGARAG
jgi:hypothetical protein